jgi:hypothetical protein
VGPAGAAESRDRRADSHDRLAAATFAALVALALPYLVVLGRSIWFTTDEWDFVAQRTVGNVDDLFRPNNEHWSTLPVLVYRGLWAVFGLRTHLPHQIIVTITHLAVAVLLRAVMRRAGVSPWLATIVAGSFVFFGTGYGNVLFAFQMSWCAAVAFCLGSLLLIDHDGPVDRRDWIALGLSIGALMCTSAGVTMAIVVGLAALLRRGWRLALFLTVPLATAYLVWWFGFGRSHFHREAGPVRAARFMTRTLWATWRDIGQVPGVGVVLIVVLAVGLALALRPGWPRTSQASCVASLAGSVIFLFITGIGRADVDTASSNISRYQYVAAALALPALALAADALVARWRVLVPVVVAVVLAGIPGNFRAMQDGADRLVAQSRVDRLAALSFPQNPYAKELPRTEHLLPYAPFLTVGWVLDSVPSGRVPKWKRLTPDELATQTLALALQPSTRGRPHRCRSLRAAMTRTLHVGDTGRAAAGAVDVVYFARDGGRSVPRHLTHAPFALVAGPLRLRFSPVASPPHVICFAK